MKRLLLLFAVSLPLLAEAKIEVKIDDLAWLAGHWSADGVEEVWLAPSGNVMTGMNRTVKNGRATFEFFRIAATKDGGLGYYTQPGGRPATLFTLTESSESRVVFSNPEHDFPKRILYFMRDAQLCARIEGEDGKGEEWCWSRVR